MNNLIASLQFAAVIWVLYSLARETALKLKWNNWPITCLKCTTFWVSLAITPFVYTGIDIITIPAIAALIGFYIDTQKITL
jgi:hypothetical protein